MSTHSRIGPDISPTKPSVWIVVGFLLTFCFCITGAWAWFNIGNKDNRTGISISPRREVPDYRFKEEPLGEGALEILATTNLLNGSFIAVKGEEFRVFWATWNAESGKKLTVVHHTPDICWIGAGWKPVDLGQSEQITLMLPLRSSDGSLADRARQSSINPAILPLPTECRIFVSPDRKSFELVVWFTLLGGRVLPESRLFRGTHDETKTPEASGRRVASSHFLKSVSQRLSVKGSKQFVRLSIPLKDDWRTALDRIKEFSAQWLAVTVESDLESARF